MKTQQFGKQESPSEDLTVVTKFAVEAEEVRIAKRKTKKGKKLTDVKVGKQCLVKVVMFRPDTNTETLREGDRCMKDYEDAKMPQLHKRWAEQARKHKPPWRPKVE